MEEIELIVLIPTIRESHFDKKYYPQEIVNKAQSEFVIALAQIEIQGLVQPQIFSEVIHEIHTDLKQIYIKYGISENSTSILFRLKCFVDYQPVYKDILSINERGFDEMKLAKDIVHKRLSEKLIQEINELYIICQLSQPGALKFKDGIILVNNDFLTDYKSYGGFIRDAYSNIIEKDYPKFEFVSLDLLKSKMKDNSISFSSNPSNKLEKAINCFTHAIKPNLDIVEIMMYSIIGLETLYVTGEANIQKQINDKVQLFLGELKEHKKLIKALYNSRSKLFHGEYYLQPYHFHEDDNLYDYSSKIEDELFEAFSYSIMILIATIQKMILGDRKELVFKQVLIN